MRRDFRLPAGDEAYLSHLGNPWEAIRDAGLPWLLIHEFGAPEAYSQPLVTVAILVTPGYPDAQLDMAYFHPALSRKDGVGINAICIQGLDGKPFQRWSRHRTPANPWRPGVDDVASHLELVRYWLEREFKK